MVRASTDNLHSRVVVILKVTLPLVALAILSTLFLFSRGIDPKDAIPYADVDIADRLAQPRMTGAGFSTTMSDGAALTVSAAEATPGVAGGGVARGVTGILETPDGGRTEIAAMAADFDTANARIALGNGVELRNALGYVVSTDGLEMGADRSWMQTTGPVVAVAPMGQLTAGSLRLDRASPNAPYLLVFKGGVRLLYQPQN